MFYYQNTHKHTQAHTHVFTRWLLLQKHLPERNGSTCFRYRGTASSLSKVNSASTMTDGLEVDKATSSSISRTLKALAINPDSSRGKIPCTVSLPISPMPELCGDELD